jgi:tRNA (guanine37-N1)-methyltransferase
LRIEILTIFPALFKSPLEHGTLRIAQEKQLLEIVVHDLRDYTHDRHRQVDDAPYGGGAGMVMKPEPFYEAVETIAAGNLAELKKKAEIILLTPQGEPFSQNKARELAGQLHLIFLCGRYEGVDERVRDLLVTDEISIGDYVVSGGELPALIVMEAVIRLIPGVLGAGYSVEEESFRETLLEYPQYTRPAEYRNLRVPEVLLSGDHARIEEWRRRESIKRTLLKRPDLLNEQELDARSRELYLEIREMMDRGEHSPE